MTLANPSALAGLLVVAGLAVLAWRCERRSASVLRWLGAEELAARRKLRALAGLAALALLVLALADPRAASAQLESSSAREVGDAGIDLMVVLDTSRSMQATDADPTRFALALQSLESGVAAMPGVRLGLVRAAGDGRVVCPLTTDHQALLDIAKSLEPELSSPPGSDLGAALSLALDRLAEVPGRRRGVWLISDGEHLGDGGSMAEAVAAREVQVWVTPVGSEQGAQLYALDAAGVPHPRTDPETGDSLITRAYPERLAAVAAQTGGWVIPAGSAALNLRGIFGPGSAPRRAWYQWLILMAMLGLLFEFRQRGTA